MINKDSQAAAAVSGGHQQELKEYQQIVESLREGLLLVDQSLHIRMFNPAALLIMGAESRDVRGERLDTLLNHSDLFDMVELLLQRNSAIEETFIFPQQNGFDRRVKVYGKRVLGKQYQTTAESSRGSFGIMLVLSDVTQLHKLERVRRDFVANVSHELKTPITSIKASVETLVDGALEDKDDARTFVNMIGRQSDRLLEIVEDLLNLSRLQSESGGSSLNRSRCTIYSLFQRVREACEQRAIDNGIVLEFEFQEGLEGHINAGLVRQALVNLTENAIKSSAEGSAVVLSVKHVDDTLEFRVKDEGCGIAPAHLGRIFERFYRVDSGRGRDKGGSGLGLAIVKHIVQAHGGEVGVASELGKGSTFVIRLPQPLLPNAE